MTKELPMAIAPDGEVIQLRYLTHEEENNTEDKNVCDFCFVRDTCDEIKECGIADLLDVRCSDYDLATSAVWEKVDGQ